jgi:hypothetical protein
MNKYVLMLAAAGLIAAAPVYYAFQANAEEAAPVAEQAADEAAAEEAPAVDAAPAPVEAPAEAPAADAHDEEGHAH